MADSMKWLLRPVFHEDGMITFEKWKYVKVSEIVTVVVHKDMNEFRAFYGR